MAVFPTRVFTRDNVYSGWKDLYTSNLIGRKAIGYPRGVYKGFVPQLLTDPTNILDLTVDSTDGISILKVKSSATEHVMDLFLDTDITLDFTGQTFAIPNTEIYVIARAVYKIGNITTAEIFTRALPGNGVTEINICSVTKPGVNLVIDTTVRNTPLATVGMDYGFMPTDSVNNLAIITDTSEEVIAARIDTDSSTAQTDLSLRLLQDFNTIDDRLSRVIDLLQGNTHTILSGQTDRTKLNVSGSLGNLTRVYEPKITIPSGGSLGIGTAGSDGAITTAPDNLAIPIDPVTGQRFINAVGSPVYARLQPNQTIVSSGINISFVNAQTVVSGDGDFTTLGIEIGDTLSGPDGNTYVISDATPITASSFTISPSYQNQSNTVTSLTFSRSEISFFVIDSGSEVSYSFGAGDIDIQVFLNAVMPLGAIRQDSRASFLKAAQTPLPNATTSLKGQIIFATNGEETAGEVLQASDTKLVDICKTDGSTPFSSVQSYDNSVTLANITNDTHLVTREYVDQFSFTQIAFRESQDGIQGTNTFTTSFPFDVKVAYAGLSMLVDTNGFGTGEGIVEFTSLIITGDTVSIQWEQGFVSSNTLRLSITAAG